MSTIAQAIYEHGVLRLLTPVELPEKAHVLVQILDEDMDQPLAQRVESVLSATGLIKSRTEIPAVRSVSAKRRSELARLYSNATSLSDFIIAERDEQ